VVKDAREETEALYETIMTHKRTSLGKSLIQAGLWLAWRYPMQPQKNDDGSNLLGLIRASCTGVDAESSLTIGKTLAHYRAGEQPGRGAMREVCLIDCF
jgi:hypothetical protein